MDARTAYGYFEDENKLKKNKKNWRNIWKNCQDGNTIREDW